MSVIFPFVSIDSDSLLCTYFLPYQVSWINAEESLHDQKKQAFALAEKSVRIGWTYADAFKNVAKRLRFKNRDYLFATKDYPSALEYMRIAKEFIEFFSLSKAMTSHGEEYLKPVSRGPAAQELKMSYIKFDTGSRIIAFSAHPQAMAVYGGDVGLDEFAKHPNAELLWQTAQGRVTWGYDMAVWSSHEGDDTLFNQFAQQARATLSSSSSNSPCSHSPHTSHQSHSSHPSHPASASSPIEIQNSKIKNPSCPWNLYFRVTITDAIECGLLNIINDTRDTSLTPAQFLADCRSRAGLEQIFQQSYMCNPVPAGASIVEWSAIERCRSDYQIERVHLEAADIIKLFGDFNPARQLARHSKIESFLKEKFPILLSPPGALHNSHSSHSSHSASARSPIKNLRLGFDVAASGQGDLTALYFDEARADDLWLRALFTCRTEDWDFIKTVLFFFMANIPRIRAAGDESGLGREICWEAAQKYSWAFKKVNFASIMQDLGFTLMNQLASAQKHFPKDQHDIAADFFALRKSFQSSRWIFSEGRNALNPASHCDIAWAGALATCADKENECEVRAIVVHESGWSDGAGFHPFTS
jgi:phage FluMu gp28-like protein